VEQDKDNTPPVCNRCENVMERIGTMPGLGLHPPVQVFRCFDCKIVFAEMTPSRNGGTR
jgi:hypothetical protein